MSKCTYYNERLDEVLQNLSWKQHELGTKGLIPLSSHEYEAKQAITSLIKELVAEAREQGVKDAYVAINDVERLHLFNDGDEVIAHLSNTDKE